MSWCDKHECYESDYGSQCRDREIDVTRIKVLEAEVAALVMERDALLLAVTHIAESILEMSEAAARAREEGK